MGSRTSIFMHDYFLLPVFIAACEKGNSQTLRFLIESGFSVDSELSIADGRFKQTPLWVSASYGHLDNVHILVQKKADVNKCLGSPDNCFTPLMVATKYGHIEIVKFLLKNGAKSVVECDDIRTNALLFAVRSRRFELVRLFVANDLSVNEKNSKGESALYWACKEDVDIAITSLLLDNHADPNVFIKGGDSCLYWACRNNNYSAVELLLLKGADPAFVSPNSCLTSLHVACSQGSLELVKLLLDAGANVNIQCDSYTPLYLASKFGHLNLIDTLIEGGACVDLSSSEKLEDMFQTRIPGKFYPEEYMLTPIYIAWLKGHHSIVSKLLTKTDLKRTANLAKFNNDLNAEAYFRMLELDHSQVNPN